MRLEFVKSTRKEIHESRRQEFSGPNPPGCPWLCSFKKFSEDDAKCNY